MVKRRATCGLCKPQKKWKQNDPKRKHREIIEIEKEIFNEVEIKG